MRAGGGSTPGNLFSTALVRALIRREIEMMKNTRPFPRTLPDKPKKIETKMNNMSGKMGVALTANQLVDHVSNQSLNLSINRKLNINKKYTGIDKYNTTTPIDRVKPGKESISKVISAFLNAYVDVAKDPYISRGNHNDVTANATFLLVRSNVDIRFINRFIGQPILREYVKLKKHLIDK